MLKCFLFVGLVFAAPTLTQSPVSELAVTAQGRRADGDLAALPAGEVAHGWEPQTPSCSFPVRAAGGMPALPRGKQPAPNIVNNIAGRRATDDGTLTARSAGEAASWCRA